MGSRNSKRGAKRRRPQRSPRADPRQAGAADLVDVMTDTMMLAKGCWDHGQRDQAVGMYERAVKESPRNVRAYTLLARAYAERCRLGEMEAVLERLTRLAPNHPGVHHFVGETYALVKLHGQSVAAYETACGLPGVLPGTWMELASLYERSHRLDEARDLIDRASQAALPLPALRLIRARVEVREKQLDTADATLRSLIERLPADNDWACQAWSEVALLKDKQGDYAAAAEAIGHCKDGQRGRSEKDWAASEAVGKRFGAMVDSVSAEDFLRWQDEASDLPDARNALLTGFPRSGTTLLEQVLDAHVGLVSSEERDFLGNEQFSSLHETSQRRGPILDVLNGLTPKRIRAEQKRYFAVMEHLLGEPVAGRMHLDKNPAYNALLPIALRLFPQMRLLIALRDPRDVVLSCYLRYLPLNPVSVNFLTVERTAQRYAIDMNAWLKFREIVPNPWCEVRYEDSVADLEKQARRALETLGLPWDPAVMNYRDRLGKERQVSSPTYEAVKQPVYTRSVGRWKHYEEHLAPAFETLAPFIEAFGYDG